MGPGIRTVAWTQEESRDRSPRVSVLFVSLSCCGSYLSRPSSDPPPPPSVHREDKAMHAKGTTEVREAGCQAEPGERKGRKCGLAPSA